MHRNVTPVVDSSAAARTSVAAPGFLALQLQDFIAVAAESADPVLLLGETGVGKTYLARIIHELSPRRSRPFIPVNCGAIPHDLFEREMFGHVRGSFTGATDSRPGLFEAANGGTLFLDEIGEMPLAAQPKLLRVLEEGSVRRLGSTRYVPVDTRIIVATNQDLRRLVQEKRFRADLFYRCCVLEYEIPPLRERRREIPDLVRELLGKLVSPSREMSGISDEALERLCSCEWRGNIRELDNTLRQALIRSRGGPIESRHLPERVRRSRWRESGSMAEQSGLRRRYAAPEDVQEEQHIIRDALQAEGGNRTRAARRLNMARSTLWVKLKQYGIE